jgi:hypothetical protein
MLNVTARFHYFQPEKKFTVTTSLSSQKTLATILPADEALLMFFLPCWCRMVPLHRLPFGFGLRVVDLVFNHCDHFTQEALTSSVVSVQKISDKNFLFYFYASVSICGTELAIAKHTNNQPLHCFYRWLGWSTIHLLLCDGRRTSVHPTGRRCQAIQQCKGDNSAVCHGVPFLLIHNFNSSTHRQTILTSRIPYLTLWTNVRKCKSAAQLQQPTTRSLLLLKAH